MNNTYNDKIYLKTSDLNNIENEIESVTNEIQEKVFNNQSSPLRNIAIGDNLNGKTLYLSFPKEIYDDIGLLNGWLDLISTDNLSYIRCWSYQYSDHISYDIYLSYFDTKKNERKIYYVYGSVSTELNPQRRNVRMKLPYDVGVVTNINNYNGINQYIKIYDDETIIPDYEKHVWSDNEVLSMQKLDNIENGIKNIGYYFYKDSNWISTKEWLKTCSINEYNANKNIQNISYRDLNRWLTDLSLIDFEELNEMTIWNSNISQISYNFENEQEWEEL